MKTVYGKILGGAGLLLLYSLSVLYTIRPWRAYFFTGLADHWDPKLMGEWMAWNAHHILSGRFFLPDYHANFFYPHAYTLAFSELLWPQSFVYALFYKFSENPFFSYNGTLLVYWGISGVVAYLFFRELDLSRTVCVIGGFIFCLIPYRLAYYVEFNMTLTFIIPLLLLLIIRFLKQQDLFSLLVFCFGYLISATSCIYYTLIGAIPVACVILSGIANNPKVFRNKTFYTYAVLGMVCLVFISVLYLYPYLILNVMGGFSRTATDHNIHHGQVFHYFTTNSSFLASRLFDQPTRMVETELFPGTVLTVLFSAFVFFHVTTLFSKNEADKSYKNKIQLAIPFLWTAFLGIVWYRYFIETTCSGSIWAEKLLYPVGLTLLGFHFFSIFISDPSQPENRVVISGLCAAAVICFFITLGANITTGVEGGGGKYELAILSKAPMAGLLEIGPFFKILRVLTRFSVVVLFFFIAAGCWYLNIVLISVNSTWLRSFVAFCIPVLLIYEGSQREYFFVDLADIYHSEAIQALDGQPQPLTLLQIPAGPRTVDSMIVLQTIGKFHYLLNGHSGFSTKMYDNICSLMKHEKFQAATGLIEKMWPPVYLVVKQDAIVEPEYHYEKKMLEWKDFDSKWQKLKDDQYYGLYQPKEQVKTASSFERIIRSDLLKKYPVLSFSAKTSCVTRKTLNVTVWLNGSLVGKQLIVGNWGTYQIKMPARFSKKNDENKVVIKAESTPSGNMKGDKDMLIDMRAITFRENEF